MFDFLNILELFQGESSSFRGVNLSNCVSPVKIDMNKLLKISSELKGKDVL